MMRQIGALIGLLVSLAFLAPLWAPYDPESQYREFLFAPPMAPHLIGPNGLQAPFVYPITLADRLTQKYVEDRSRTVSLPWFNRTDDPVFLLGADSFGRDLLSRLMYGTRVSVLLAIASSLGALLIGALIGGLAGYRGGWLDEMAMRLAEFVLVLPVIYVVLVLRSMMPLVLDASTVFVLMTGIFTLVGWPFVARGVRGIVSVERDRESVVAARSLGAGGWRIFRHHLLPAFAGYLVVQATLLLPAFILAEATLSYVGLGFPQGVPTWGTMLTEASGISTITRFPWTLAPAGAIFLVVLSTNAILQSDKISRRPL